MKTKITNLIVACVAMVGLGIGLAEIFIRVYPPLYEAVAELSTAKYGSVIIPTSQTIYASVPRTPVGTEVFTPAQLGDKITRADFNDGSIDATCGSSYPPKNLSVQINSAGLVLKLKGRHPEDLQSCLKSIGAQVQKISDKTVDAQKKLMDFQLKSIENYRVTAQLCNDYQHKLKKELSVKNMSLINLLTNAPVLCPQEGDLKAIEEIQKEQMEKPTTEYAAYKVYLANSGNQIFPLRERAYVAGALLGLLILAVFILVIDILKKRKL